MRRIWAPSEWGASRAGAVRISSRSDAPPSPSAAIGAVSARRAANPSASRRVARLCGKPSSKSGRNGVRAGFAAASRSMSSSSRTAGPPPPPPTPPPRGPRPERARAPGGGAPGGALRALAAQARREPVERLVEEAGCQQLTRVDLHPERQAPDRRQVHVRRVAPRVVLGEVAADALVTELLGRLDLDGHAPVVHA